MEIPEWAQSRIMPIAMFVWLTLLNGTQSCFKPNLKNIFPPSMFDSYNANLHHFAIFFLSAGRRKGSTN